MESCSPSFMSLFSYLCFSEHEFFFIDELVATPRAGILQRDTKVTCLLCDRLYILGNMRAHVGQHILHHVSGDTKGKATEVSILFVVVTLYQVNTFAARVGTMRLLWW